MQGKAAIAVEKRDLLTRLNNSKMKGESIMISSTNRRNEMRNLLQVKEVRDFYSKLQVSLRTQVLAGGLDIPELVMDRIKELLSTYSGLYDEVQVVPIGLDGRVVIGIGEAEGKWDHITATIEELQDSVDLMEMEDIRVGGFIPIGQGVIQDSAINMALYLEDILSTCT